MVEALLFSNRPVAAANPHVVAECGRHLRSGRLDLAGPLTLGEAIEFVDRGVIAGEHRVLDLHVSPVALPGLLEALRPSSISSMLVVSTVTFGSGTPSGVCTVTTVFATTSVSSRTAGTNITCPDWPSRAQTE